MSYSIKTSVHLFPSSLVTVGHGGGIYTVEIGKCNKLGLFSLENWLNVGQHILEIFLLVNTTKT